MSVQTQIDRISDEVSTQADLIAQIATALDGLSAGGSSGSGGTTLETCGFEVFCNTGTMLHYTSLDGNGNIIAKSVAGEGTMLIATIKVYDVVCGSCVTITSLGSEAAFDGETTAEILEAAEAYSVIKAPTVSGEVCCLA